MRTKTTGLLLLLNLFSLLAFSQNVTLGTRTGASSTNVLLATSTTTAAGYSRTASLYTAAEIIAAGGHAGVISKLWWAKEGTGEYLSGNAQLKVYIKPVSMSTFPGTITWATDTVGSSLVFSNNTFSLPSGAGWMQLTLSNPFVWNGTDNLEIFVDWYRPSNPTAAISWARSTNASMNASTTSSTGSPGAPATMAVNSNRPLLQLELIDPTANDAAMFGIYTPAQSISAGLDSVSVKVRNWGGQNISSLELHWDVDGVVQTPVNHGFSPALASTDSSAVIKLGNYTFAPGYHTIRTWTVNPNGQPDADPRNDTMTLKIWASYPALSGNYTINPALTQALPNFTSFESAIRALNESGISGTVYFDVPANTLFRENNLLITATGTATDSIVFRKSGTGNNPVIAANSGTSSRDYIIGLEGSDYIVFDGINVMDTAAANSSSNAQMEWGYALFRKSDTDGPQYNTIRNCRIELKRDRTAGVGIYSINQSAASSTSINASQLSGTNSYNQFFNDSVINCNTGISVTGTVQTSGVYDEDVQIGVKGGNVVLNFGGTSTKGGIYVTQQNNVKIANNTVHSGSGVTSAINGIHGDVGLGSNIDIYNNTVTILTSSTSASTGIENTIGSKGTTNTVNIYGNKIIDSYAGSFQAILVDAIAPQVNIHHNLIENDSTSSTSSIYVIEAGSATGDFAGTVNIHDNIIRNFKRTSVSSSTLYGIYNGQLIENTVSNIYNNQIYNITAAGGTGILAGIYTYGPGSSRITTQNVYQNTIYNLSSEGPGRTMGINLSGAGSNAFVKSYAYNNFIYGLKASNSFHAEATIGIYSSNSSPTAFTGIYYNTIYLNDSVLRTDSSYGSSGISAHTSTPVDIRNNIVINRSTPGGTSGIVAAYRRSTTSLATYSDSSNNNIFNVGTTGNRRYVYYDGTDSAVAIGAFRSKMATRDQNSIGAMPQFINITTIPYNLRIDGSAPTPVESAARPVTDPITITTDFDGNPRDAATPDIGANEGSFIAADVEGPSISYVALKNTGSFLNRTLEVSISDASGVDSSASGQPLLYYRKNGSGFISTPATSRYGDTYTFTIDYALVGGAFVNDVIDYYVAAQDLSVYYNPSTRPDGGEGSFPPGYIQPVTPSSYTILGSLSGTYYVGTTLHSPAATYATLKDALADYAVKGMTGSVEFVLIDSVYNTSTGETLPILVNENPDASAVNTLTIKPEQGVNVRIEDAAAFRSSVIKLNGSDYVTINGMNTANTSLSIINTQVLPHLDSLNAVVWISNAGAGNGATNNTIKNCSILGMGPRLTQIGVFMGTAISTGYNQFVEANSFNNVLDSNYISKAQFGIVLMGSSALNPAMNNKITNNRLGTAFTDDGFYQQAVFANRQDGMLISGNDIQNVYSDEPLNSDDIYGINLINCRNADVHGNRIHNLKFTGNTFTLVMGISSTSLTYKTAGNPSNNLFYNNAVYDLTSTSTAFNFNTGGINLSDGYGDKVYFNSVYLTGQLSAGNGPSAAFSNGYNSIIGNSPTYGTNIDVRNNIFAVTGTTGTSGTKKLYAHYSKAPDYTSSILDNNILYVNTTAPAVGFTGGLNGLDYASLSDWKTITGKENASLGTDPQLNTPLVLIPQSGSPAINAGTPVAGITLDLKGEPRNGSTPSIGAYETAGDFRGPDIGITALKNTTLTTNVSAGNLATIADNNGVNTNSGSKPRIYYKKSSDANVLAGNTALDNGWKYTEASNSSSPFSFTIDYSLLNGGTVSVNDTIQYFIVAQDNAPVPNVGSSSTLFNPAQSVNLTGTSFPAANFHAYRIIPGAQGFVYVGSGQPYLNLTDAGGLFEALKSSLILTGDVTVLVTSDLMENGTNDLTPWQEEGAGGYHITIRPDQVAPRSVSGTVANGLIRLNGVSNVTFDGTDTASHTGTFLTFSNLNTSNPVFTFINDARFDTIRNCVIEGASTSSTGLVYFTTATAGGNNFNAVTNNIITNAGTARYNTGINSTGSSINRNNSNTLSGNQIRNFSGTGIYVSSNSGDNWIINNNTLYDTLSPAATSAQSAIEFFAQSKNNQINDNYIGGLNGISWTSSGNNAFIGITASFDVNGPNEIRRNVISNIERTNVSTAASFTGIRVSRGTVVVSGNLVGDTLDFAKGIRVSGATVSTGIDITNTVANASINVQNNTVSRIITTGTTAANRLRGISYSNTSTTNTLPLMISGNRIFNLWSYSNATGLNAGEQSVTGIYCNPNTSSLAYADVQISNNILHTLVAAGTADTGTVSTAMMLNNVKGTVNANQVYHIRNYSTRINALAPATSAGLILRATDQLIVSNNMITVGYDTTDDIQYIGIWNPVTGLGARLYHNTVNVRGYNYTDVYSYALLRGTNNPADLVNSPLNGNNNIFQNDRLAFNAYLVGSNGTTGFGSQSWNNNVYAQTNPAKLGNWNGNSSDLAQWKTLSQKDSVSQLLTVIFLDPLNGDLHLSGTSVGNPNLAGITIPVVSTDFDGETRFTYPYVGADENTGAPLPVTLTQFAAKAVNSDVNVIWTTASEKNAAYFIVEASVDGKTFTQAGKVNAAGNSTTARNYVFTHRNAQRELNAPVAYYRLVSVDRDGSAERSRIAEVRFNEVNHAGAGISAYPNPFNSTITLNIPALTDSEAVMELTDMQGKHIQSVQQHLVEGQNTFAVNTPDYLEKGIYFLRITTATGTQVIKLLKQ